MPTSDWLVSPRVGFNWDVRGDKTFQIRGGTGVFTGRLPFVWIGNQIANPNVFFLQMVDPILNFHKYGDPILELIINLNLATYGLQILLILKTLTVPMYRTGVSQNLQEISQVDNREYYLEDDIINNAYVFTNSDKGRTINITTKIEKSFENGWYR